MKSFKIKYIMSFLTVLLLLPVMNFNLYSRSGDDDGGDGHGDRGKNSEVTGLITAISASSITVDTTQFAVNSETKVEGNGKNFSYDSLKVGDTVKVAGRVIDSVLTAVEIKLLNNRGGDDNEGEHSEFSVTGLITVLSDSSLTVDGKNIFFTDSTVIRFENKQNATKSDLSVGLKVEVEGVIVDSAYFAQKIQIEGEKEDSSQEFEITGKILTLGLDNFTLDTLTIYVSPLTIITKPHFGLILFGDLMAGDSVRVKGTIDSNKFNARKIEVIVNEEFMVEAEGIVSDLSDSSLVVDNKTFVINTGTRFYRDDTEVNKSALSNGDKVKIKGFIVDSTYISKEIRILGEKPDSSNKFELEGLIVSISGDSVDVNGTTFTVDSNTVIRKEHQGLILFSDLTVGMKVEVKGFIVNDVKIASKIDVQSDMSEDNELKGEITAILDSTFTVNNTVITVTPETIIVNKEENVIPFSDLAVGNFVKVKLNIVDSTNFALKVEVKKESHNHNDSDEVSDIDMVFNDHFSANNKSYIIDKATSVYNKYGNLIPYNTLSTGMKVYIYEDIKNNQLYAGRIDVLQSVVLDVNVSATNLVELDNSPNPFIDQSMVKVNIPADGNIVCSLYNASGAKVMDIYSGYASKGEINFEINGNSNLVSGIYYINLLYNGTMYVRPIVKLK